MYKLNLTPYNKIFYNEWKISPERTDYNITFDQELCGELNLQRLNDAISSLIKDYVVLNSHILDIDGELYWIENGKQDNKYFIEALAAEEIKNFACQAFDLEQGPLYRFGLASVSEKRFRLIIVLHHIVIDGISFDFFIEELSNYYNNPEYHASITIEKQKENIVKLVECFESKNSYIKDAKPFWEKHLSDLEAVDYDFLKVREELGDSSKKTKEIVFQLGDDIYKRLLGVKEKYEISSYFFSQAIYAVLLYKYTGKLKFGISYPVSIREGSHFIYGANVNINLIPYDFTFIHNIYDLIYQVRMFTGLLKHGDAHNAYFPVMELAQNLGKEYFNNIFSQTNLKNKTLKFNHVVAETVHEFNLDLPNDFIFEQEIKNSNIVFRVKYHQDKIDEELLSQYIENYKKLFELILSDLENSIDINSLPTLSSYPLISNSDYEKIIYAWNDTKSNFPDQKTIHEVFEEQVLLYPNRVAMIYKDKSLTYKELNEKANRLANYLVEVAQLKPDSLVALCLDKSEQMLVSILAVLKAGAAYVPMDPGFPLERMKFILEDTKASVLLTQEKYHSQLANISSTIVLAIDNEKLLNKLSVCSIANPLNQVSSSNLAYIIYTSGTTGKPKGVLIEHKGVINLAYAERENFGIRIGDNVKNILWYSNYVFDAHVFEVFTTILSGQTIHIIDEEIRKDLRLLQIYIKDYSIHVATIPPALLDTELLLPLEVLIVAGEKTDQKILDFYVNNNVKVINAYGPTEITVCSSVNHYTQNGKNNIGKPNQNMTCYVLDRNLMPLPIGAIGELYIGGIGVARGYLNNPELSRERFIPNPFQTDEEKISGDNSRIYKTGDLVSWQKDGSLKYIGREDMQVKIRGRRIELGEIESVISSYPGINQAIALVNKENMLIAYYVSSQKIEEGDILKYLHDRLPEYMLPNALMWLEKLPITINGKIDKKALPSIKLNHVRDFKMPRDQMEGKILKILSEVLAISIDSISINDDFFWLGGNSITAIRLVSKIRQKLEIDISVKDIFTHRTIKCLYDAVISTKNCNKASEIMIQKSNQNFFQTNPPNSNFIKRTYLPTGDVNGIISVEMINKIQESIEIEDIYLANSMQNSLVSHAMRCDNIDDAYQIQLSLRYQTYINSEKFKQAWLIAQGLFPSLRLRFVLGTELLQVINKHGELDWKEYDLSTLEEKDFTTRLQEIKSNDWNRGYKLEKGNLFRIILVKKEENNFICLFSSHHSIIDGWSCSVLINKVHEIYFNLLNNNAINMALDKSYSVAQRYLQDNQKQHAEFWKKTVESINEQLSIESLFKPNLAAKEYEQGSYARVVESKELNLIVNKSVLHAIQAISQREGITLNSILQLLWHKVLAIYCGITQTVTGTIVSGRNLPIDDIEQSVGAYINTLPLVVNHSEYAEKTLIESARTIQDCIYDLNDRSNVQISFLKKNKKRLFDSLFAYENYPDSQLSKYQASIEEIKGKAAYPLSLVVNDKIDNFVISLQYAGELFSETLMKNLLISYENLLLKFLQNPEVKFKTVNLLDEMSYQRTVYDWNHKEGSPLPSKTIQQLFEEQVIRTPDNIALVHGNVSLTYRGLNERANQLANYLINEYKVKQGQLVALFLDRSEKALIAMLAVLKSGAAYLPIGIEYPDERVLYILKDSKTDLVITEQAWVEKLQKLLNEPDLNQLNLLSVDNPENLSILVQSIKDNPCIEVSENNLCYVIYTSGTTGQPKGVVVEHKGVVNLALTQKIEFNLEEIKPKNFLWYANYVFDAHVWEAYVSILNGQKLYIASGEMRKNILTLKEYIKKESINIALLPPALLNTQDELELDILLVGGEKTSQEILEHYHKRGTQVFNAYGPTEVTVYSHIKRYQGNSASNIGSCIPNFKCYVLDSFNVPVPVGVVGELYISGIGLARGYLNQEKLTQEKFLKNEFVTINSCYDKMYKTGDLVKWLPSGELEYVGRIDSQIKIRGHRIEISEIENQLLTFPGVKQCAIDVKEHATGKIDGKFLVAYYVSDYLLNKEEMRHFLQNKLPDYMMPSKFLPLQSLPLTINGKLDKKSLPGVELLEKDFHITPQSPAEIKICKIFSEIFGGADVGINDDFFEMGGNSILAMRLTACLNDIYQANIKVSDIYLFPKIYQIKEKIEANVRQFQVVVKLNTTSDKPNLFMIHPAGQGCEVYAALAKALSKEFCAYGIDSYNLLCVDKIKEATDLAQFYLSHIEQVMMKSKQDTYHLLGWSLGGQLALEMAYLLERKGYQHIKVYLLDSLIPDQVLMSSQHEFSPMECFDQASANAIRKTLEVEIEMSRKLKHRKLRHTQVLLLKAMQFGESMMLKIDQKTFNYVSQLPYNNVDKILSKEKIKLVKVKDANHTTLIDQVNLLVNEIEEFKAE